MSFARCGAAEIICWALGIVLIVFYFGARAYGEMERRQALSAFTELSYQATAAHTDTDGLGDADQTSFESLSRIQVPDQTHWSASRVRAYAPASASSASLPAALLRIARLGLEVPVYVDTNERNLNRGAGLIEGTASPDGDGNIGIAAHRDGYFRVLERVVVGDVLELETLSRQRRYRVTDLSIVEPVDMSPLSSTPTPAITLVTCYPFHFAGSAPQRFIVRAVAM